MALNKRQETILEIVKEHGPITGENIAEMINLTRATLRPDLAILTMSGYLDAKPRLGYFYKERPTPLPMLEFLEKYRAKDFQSMPIVIHEEISAYDAVCSMFLEDVGTLFVTNKANLLSGVISRKDLLRASIGNNDLHSIPVSVIMTRMPNITVCEKDDSLLDIAQKLITKQIDSLPIVKKQEAGYEVIGRITKTNMTKAFLQIVKPEED